MRPVRELFLVLSPWAQARAAMLTCALALAGLPSSARAQAGADDTAPPDDNLDLPGEETPELRALRLAELEIFGRYQPLIELSPSLPRPLRLSVPDALTSDAPEIEPGAGTSGRRRDLSWLEGLVVPDIPVRWDDRVIRYLEFFREDPRGQQLIRSWMRRVDHFGTLIRRTLREEGLPEDLIYVAMVESGFDPRARSDAGAVGLWQFIARTGREYGLRQDRWVDMRMDPEASTRAGARYLAALHRRLGTWELALAAYNAGYGALLRAILKYNTNDYWELSYLEAALPFETSLYVAKVMACAIIARNPDRFGLADLARDAPIEYDVVEAPAGAPLGALARAAGTTVEELRRLNPALRRNRVPPGSEPWRLRIPRGRRDAFERAWSRNGLRQPAHRSYVVRFGEDLAAVARRFGISEAQLRELNQIDDEERIGAGVALVVPSVEPRDPRPSERPVIAIPPGTFEYADRRRVFYRVVRGDDLREIARFFGVSLDEIQQWNVIDLRAALQEGMWLQLFVPAHVDLGLAVVLTESDVRTLVIGSEEFYEWHARQEGRVRFRYRVRPGDTLSTIAARFGLTTGSMARINQISRDSILRVGRELIVYTTPDRLPAEFRDRIEWEGAPAEAPAGDASAARAAEAEAEAPAGDASAARAAEAEAEAPAGDASAARAAEAEAEAPASDASAARARGGDETPPVAVPDEAPVVRPAPASAPPS
jgi:membrane-bound lytic murein transglycosylase D